MKKKILVLAGMAAMLASGSNAYAATGHASATIERAIGITEDAAGTNGGLLNFGHIIPGTAGTVVVGPNGVGEATGPTLTTRITTSAAQFIVSGDAARTYALTLPGSTTISNGTTTMTVNAFTENATNTIGAGGTETFNVGGTLTVSATQAAGTYTGTFEVTAVYN